MHTEHPPALNDTLSRAIFDAIRSGDPGRTLAPDGAGVVLRHGVLVTLFSVNVDATAADLPERIRAFVTRWALFARDENALLGVFQFEGTRYSLDVNVAVPRALMLRALAFAKTNRQQCVWLADTAECVPSGAAPEEVAKGSRITTLYDAAVFARELRA